MTDISSISGAKKLTSQLKVSLESTHTSSQIESTLEMKEIKQFEAEINRAFALVEEIRTSLEIALRDLTPYS